MLWFCILWFYILWFHLLWFDVLWFDILWFDVLIYDSLSHLQEPICPLLSPQSSERLQISIFHTDDPILENSNPGIHKLNKILVETTRNILKSGFRYQTCVSVEHPSFRGLRTWAQSVKHPSFRRLRTWAQSVKHPSLRRLRTWTQSVKHPSFRRLRTWAQSVKLHPQFRLVRGRGPLSVYTPQDIYELFCSQCLLTNHVKCPAAARNHLMSMNACAVYCKYV